MNKRLWAGIICMIIFINAAGWAETDASLYFARDRQEAWYQQALTDGIMRLGNNLRLKRVIERAQAGEEITLAVIGGSITEGAGAGQYRSCYAYRFWKGFTERFGAGNGANVHFVNAGVGGTPSTFGLMRYERDIVRRVTDPDGLPDLVIVEFAVNDYNEPTRHRCYESLVKTILSQDNAPAVILLFSVFDGGFNLQEELKKIGNAYDLMMVSVKDAAYGHVGREWTNKEFFSDPYHPTAMGHAVMADCLLKAVDMAWQTETAAADIDLDAESAYGIDFMGLKTVYAEGEYIGIQLNRGGFASDDTRSYSNTAVGRVCGKNFYHAASDSSEPLRMTGVFRKLLIAWKASPEDSFGKARIILDGKTKSFLKGSKDSWGQSEVILVLDDQEASEHTLEIYMMGSSRDKCFTITCIGVVE